MADDVSVFYREAGPVDAPDLPGFGFTEVPSERGYKYTFENLAKTIEAFTEALGLKKYALYVG